MTSINECKCCYDEIDIKNICKYLTECDNECKCCYDEIDIKNICKYLTECDNEYKEYHFCKDCYLYMKGRLWNTYLSNLKGETCKKTLKSYIFLGFPKKYRDTKLNKEFIKICYDDIIRDTVIEKSLTDEETDMINNELKIAYDEYEKDESIDILREIKDIIYKYKM